MANTLTNLTPDLFAALDTVSRELVGMIPAVSRDSSIERAALNQTVRSAVAPEASTANNTPGQSAPDTGDQTFTNKTITISKSKHVSIRWNGEETQAMKSGPGYQNLFRDQIINAMRALVNEMEADLAGLYIKASRAVVPSGTTLFDAAATVGKDVANVRRVLAENGAPMSDLQLVLNPLAAAALRGNPQYSGANTAGQEDILRQGVLADLSGFKIRESSQIITHTPGDYDGAAEIDAVEPIGETSISVDTQGSGGVLAGDVVTFQGHNYVVSTANADVDSGNIDITAPGLKLATASSGTAVVNSTQNDRNMAFARNAIHLVTRLPAMPEGGDSADDTMIIQDPVSGLAFEIAVYREYLQTHYQVRLAWGYEMIKPEHCALLID